MTALLLDPDDQTPGSSLARNPSISDLDNEVSKERNRLVGSGEMAVGHLCYAALEHASEAITHTDQKICAVFAWLGTPGKVGESCRMAGGIMKDIMGWMMSNPIKTFLMFAGLGGTVYKGKTISAFMKDKGQFFIDWSTSESTSRTQRFMGFCALMTVRLFVSTLVPPTSPAFGIIITKATPENDKWTAMPFFLAAATVAGVMPYLLDKVFQICTGEDFRYTKFMKWFAESWPLTCWTPPIMMKVFQGIGGGKLGSSTAVIVAHAAPFMGAQTTNLQRYFLPHPLDTIISQPFGMTEDLLSMAMAEALSNAVLASQSLSCIMLTFNLAQFLIFSGRKDLEAFLCFLINALAAFFFANLVSRYELRVAFYLVGVQLFTQMFVVPFITHLVGLKNQGNEAAQQQESRIKELTERCTEREGKIKELENKNKELGKKNKELEDKNKALEPKPKPKPWK